MYLIYNLNLHADSGFQSFPADHYKKWLCLGAEGWNYPYFDFKSDSVCGREFVFQYPLEYLTLLGRRFLYWTGLLQDFGWAPPFPLSTGNLWFQVELYRTKVIALIAVLLFAVKRILKAKDRIALIFILVPLFSFAPFLIAGSSARFLLPVLPFVWIIAIKDGIPVFNGRGRSQGGAGKPA